MSTPLPCPAGMYQSIPFEDYTRLPGLSKSALDWFRKSPAHYRDFIQGRLVREDTDPLKFGRIAHAAILENKCEWVLSPFDSYRTKEAREWRDSQTLPVITHAQADDIAEWVELVRSEPLAADLLKGVLCEVSMFADDAGLRVKGRADAVGSDYFVDLKTVQDASPSGFARTIFDYGWHRQAAWYLNIAKLLGREQTRWYFIAVEKSRPARINVVELHPNAIDLGQCENEETVAALRECERNDSWPGYVTGAVPRILDVPAWAHTQFANRIELTASGTPIQF